MNRDEESVEGKELDCYTSTRMQPAQNTVLLELHVPDFEKVKDYYATLGFEMVRETKPDGKDGYLVKKITSCAFGLATTRCISNPISSVFRGVP